MSVKVLCPFFNWVICIRVELCEFFYILEIKPLSEVSFSYIFSHTVGSLFILLMFSLAMQKLYNLMKSHLFILSFMSLALGDISMKILLHGISENRQGEGKNSVGNVEAKELISMTHGHEL